MRHNHQLTNQQGTKWTGKAYMCPRKAYFGAKMAVFGPNILIILGVNKSFGTHLSENHLGTLFALFFCRARHQIGQIWSILG